MLIGRGQSSYAAIIKVGASTFSFCEAMGVLLRRVQHNR
jgi:hypothetical protein